MIDHEHRWRMDGQHSNEFCAICFMSKPAPDPRSDGRITPAEALRRKQDPLVERLRILAYAPTIAPSATYANICGEAENELRAASKAYKTLIRAIEVEGYEVLIDVDGVHSVRRREPI